MNRLKNDKTKIAVASKIDVPQNYMNEIMSEEQWWLINNNNRERGGQQDKIFSSV